MANTSFRLWLRWSRRDLRRRWVLVSAIAFIIAIGTGVFAALGSTAEWRRQSNDASYGLLRMHDLRVSLSTGSFVDAGVLDAVARGMDGDDRVVATAERLVVATQVDASTPDATSRGPGRRGGIDLAGGSAGDRLGGEEGAAPRDSDGSGVATGDDAKDADEGEGDAGDGSDGVEAVLEQKFAAHYDLPPSGTLRISGDREVRYSGVGTTPEYFMVTDIAAGLFAEANFAVLFLPVEDAQELTDHEGQVNDLVLRLESGTDLDAAKKALEDQFAAELPDVGVTVTTKHEDPVHRMLYEDIENDQKVWNLFAVLILLAAAFASFNLISRIVEAERREIGVGMALGAQPGLLAVRPMLVGVQVAIIGVVAGVAVGLLVMSGLRGLFTSVLPLPVWKTPFQLGKFMAASVLGLALPIVATVIPVWRAVRVEPVDAIRTGPHAERRSARGVAPWLSRVPLPGGVVSQMPFRNTLRAPRRTLLTLLGVAVAITALVVVLGALDSWLGTVNESSDEQMHSAGDRLLVDLDGFYPVDSEVVTGVSGSGAVAAADSGLRLIGTLKANGEEIDVFPQVIDFDAAMWSPTLVDPVEGDTKRGLVISVKAASDLNVGPGDTITFRHPRRTGALSYAMVDSEVEVTALHPDPMRFATFVDVSRSDLFGIEGITNFLQVRPAPGASEDDVKRALFGRPGVASVQPVAAMRRLVEDRLQQYVGVLRLLQGIVLALALLIAFNSASISVDERAREQATMFAFGLPVRRVLGIVTTESIITGVLGTGVGIGLGYLVLDWMMTSLLAETLPEIGVKAVINGGTLVTIMVLATATVALAPVFTLRRLRRMDVPSTLRVLE